MCVDRWLWTVRLFKTRALAAAAVRGGRVHVDGVAVKPSREVGPGDQLEITVGPVRWTVIVRGAAECRVSAPEAVDLYEETEQSAAERERQRELRGLGGPVDFGGRPTKRDRRRYDAGRRSRHTLREAPARTDRRTLMARRSSASGRKGFVDEACV